MESEALGEKDPAEILRRSIKNDRVHTAYLFTGPDALPTETARAFARALVCERPAAGAACETCTSCQRSQADDDAEEIVLDGEGKKGPTHRHIGDHPDLLWVERAPDRTRILIHQIRRLQHALRLSANEGGRRAAVINGAEQMNAEAQNALLRLLEEPPLGTSLILVASGASALLPTIRSRAVRLRFPEPATANLRGEDVSDEVAAIVEVLDGLHSHSVGLLLDFAENYRGNRAMAAEGVSELIDVSAEWLRETVKARVAAGETTSVRSLDAHRSLQQLRRDLIGRNANPQMVAERLLLGLRDTVA